MPDFPPPSILDLALSRRCQLQCDYCPIESPADDTPCDVQAILKGVSFFLNLHLPVHPKKLSPKLRINVMGGEPLLEKEALTALVDSVNAVRGTAGLDVELRVKTNLLLLDVETLRYLDDRGVTIMPRIDGCREAHDTFRRDRDGKSTWKQTIKAAWNLLPAQPNATVQMNVTPETLGFYTESVRVLHKFGFWNIHPVFPSLDPMPTEAFAELDIQVSRICGWWINVLRSGKWPRISWIENVLNCLKRGGPPKPCGAGVSRVALDSRGIIYPCYRFLNFSDADLKIESGIQIGNIDDGLANDDWKSAISKAAAGYLIDNVEACGNCEFLPYCMPTCWFNIWDKGPILEPYGGMWIQPDADYCQTQRIYYAGALRAFHILRGEGNELAMQRLGNVALPPLPGTE